MRKDEFKAGEEWAYRVKRQFGKPAAHVELVAMPKRKGLSKVKVRHLEGELEGMDEFVSAQHLLCPWKDWKKVQRDEEREQALIDYLAAQEEVDQVIVEAANAVFGATGEGFVMGWSGGPGYTSMDKSELAPLYRVAERANYDPHKWTSWPGFKNRSGDMFILDEYLVDLAIAFAKAEPETVNLYLDKEEQELLSKGYALRESFWHDYLLKQKPAWAIVRQWAGGKQARDHLKDELKRVTVLLRDAIYALHAAGEERKARRFERALEGD